MVTVSGNTAEFVFFRPTARRVCILGDFNNWQGGVVPMFRMPDGCWRARLLLPEGEYRFRYRADGQWFTDYAAFGLEPGQTGLDSIVRLSGKASAA